MSDTPRIVLVTGGSRGLGRDAVMNLAHRGFDVCFTYHANQAAADKVVADVRTTGRQAMALSLDVRDVSAFDGFAARVREALRATWSVEHLHALVNNAGTGNHATIADTTEAQFDDLCSVHLKGPFFLTQRLLPMIADGGAIVTLSSGLTRFSFPGYAAYAAMKGAIEVFTRYLAKELGERGIRANCVAPGAIDNDFNKDRFDGVPQMRDMIASMTALGRVGVSEDIGSVVAFLCSDDARWITGQRIEVSGGMLT